MSALAGDTPPVPPPPLVWGGGENREKGNPARGYRTPPRRRGALIILHDCGASRNGGEVVGEIRYNISIVEKAAAARRGGGSCPPFPGPSGQATE